MYTVKFNPIKPSYSSVIWLSSKSSSSLESVVSKLRQGRGFIRTRAIPRGRGRGRGHAHGKGHGDAFGGVGNGFVLYEMRIRRMYSGTY